jgi:hypothetical protein
MKELERRLEVVEGRVAGDDDRDAPARPVLQGREDECARLDGRAGDLQAVAGCEACEQRGALDEGAELFYGGRTFDRYFFLPDVATLTRVDPIATSGRKK